MQTLLGGVELGEALARIVKSLAVARDLPLELDVVLLELPFHGLQRRELLGSIIKLRAEGLVGTLGLVPCGRVRRARHCPHAAAKCGRCSHHSPEHARHASCAGSARRQRQTSAARWHQKVAVSGVCWCLCVSQPGPGVRAPPGACGSQRGPGTGHHLLVACKLFRCLQATATRNEKRQAVESGRSATQPAPPTHPSVEIRTGAASQPSLLDVLIFFDYFACLTNLRYCSFCASGHFCFLSVAYRLTAPWPHLMASLRRAVIVVWAAAAAGSPRPAPHVLPRTAPSMATRTPSEHAAPAVSCMERASTFSRHRGR